MVKQMPEVQDAYPFGEYHHIVLKKGITHLALPNDVVVKTATPNIEDCFMALMNNQH